MNRRQFLSSGAAGAAAVTLSKWGVYAWGAQDQKVLRVGMIGSGWYGKVNLFRMIQVAPVEVVSLCDVDKQMLEEAAELVAGRQPSKIKPRTYHDYREMLKEKDLDIAIIATPDHWHALPAIAAMEAGADLYLEKPISVDIAEGEAIVAAARKHHRTVQVNTQRRSTPHLAEAREIVRSGKLGTIGHVEICCYFPMRTRDNPADESPPANLDWEFWTGPAPMRGYNKVVHPKGWRNFMEYGNGIVGDMCVHMYDMVRWMMGLGWPTRVSSSGGILVGKDSKANITDTQTAVFDHGDVQVVWTHRTWGAPPDPKYSWAAVFYGDKGTLKASVRSFDFLPRGEGAEPIHKDVTMELDQYPEDNTEPGIEKHTAPAIRYHFKDFLQARANGTRPVADVEEAHISTASCILANMAMKLGRTLQWDSQARKVVKDDEANQLLARAYRGPWEHPCDCD